MLPHLEFGFLLTYSLYNITNKFTWNLVLVYKEPLVEHIFSAPHPHCNGYFPAVWRKWAMPMLSPETCPMLT